MAILSKGCKPDNFESPVLGQEVFGYTGKYISCVCEWN